MTNVDNMIKKMLGKAKSAQTSTSKFGVTNMFPNTTTAIKNSPIVKDIRRGYNKASKPLFKMANPNKILGGASIAKQKQWSKFSTPQRATLRRRYKDSDGDGVPNRWDCQPHNKFKQDTKKYLAKTFNKPRTGTVPIEKAKYISLYHGTQKKFIPHIMKKGLVEKTSLTPSLIVASRHASDGPENFEPTKVGLPEDFDYESGDDEPAIIKVKVKRDFLKTQVDPYAAADYRGKEKDREWVDPDFDAISKKSVYELQNNKSISPTNIKVIDINKARKKEIIKEEEFPNREWDSDFRKRLKPGEVDEDFVDEDEYEDDYDEE